MVMLQYSDGPVARGQCAVTGGDSHFGVRLLSQCGDDLCRSVHEIHISFAGTLIYQLTHS